MDNFILEFTVLYETTMLYMPGAVPQPVGFNSCFMLIGELRNIKMTRYAEMKPQEFKRIGPSEVHAGRT
jgi:hypothetical protein